MIERKQGSLLEHMAARGQASPALVAGSVQAVAEALEVIVRIALKDARVEVELRDLHQQAAKAMSDRLPTGDDEPPRPVPPSEQSFYLGKVFVYQDLVNSIFRAKLDEQLEE